MSAKEMPASKMVEEKSDSGKTIPGTADAMPETSTRGSETGEGMPRADMTELGSPRIGEMPTSEMSEREVH
jgi:hypothetical protein